MQVRGDGGGDAGGGGLLGRVIVGIEADGQQRKDGQQAEGGDAEGNGDLDEREAGVGIPGPPIS